MTIATITPSQDAIVSEIHIAAPPERVFQALIDPKQLMQWWNSEECKCTLWQIDPRSRVQGLQRRLGRRARKL
jgi:uncharacterized protein YndB with AHSA1/START domain